MDNACEEVAFDLHSVDRRTHSYFYDDSTECDSIFSGLAYHCPLLRDIVLVRHGGWNVERQNIIDPASNSNFEPVDAAFKGVVEGFANSEMVARQENASILNHKTEKECAKLRMEMKHSSNISGVPQFWWSNSPNLTFVNIGERELTE